MDGARWRPSFEMPKKPFIKRYFITGLLIWVPLGITMWVLDLLVSNMDRILLLLPLQLRTEQWLGVHIPGLGVVLTLLIVFLTGLLAANIIGQRLVRFWEGVLARIPVVNSIYNGVKQVSDTLFSQGTAGAVSAARLVDHRVPDRRAGRRCRQPSRERIRERLRSDHAEPDFRFFPDDAQVRSHRARHERRCGAQVHRFDGRGAACRQR
jgi:hypothetical protein